MNLSISDGYNDKDRFRSRALTDSRAPESFAPRIRRRTGVKKIQKTLELLI